MKFALVLLCLGGALAQQPVNPCPLGLLQKCQLLFYDILGFTPPNPPLIDGAQQLEWALSDHLNNGRLRGENSICEAYRQMWVCLGDSRDVCLSVPGFVGAHNNHGNASMLLSIFKQIDVRCGSVCEIAYAENIDCVLTINTTQAAAINTCEYNFLQSLGLNPTQNCRAVKTFEVCVAKLFVGCSLTTALCQCRIEEERKAAKFGLCDPEITKCTAADLS